VRPGPRSAPRWAWSGPGSARGSGWLSREFLSRPCACREVFPVVMPSAG
jgi:hypothetical protein